MDNKNNILDINGSKTVNIQKIKEMADNNGNGGEPPMDKYVTHEELEKATDKLNSKIDLSTEKILHQMDKRFNEIELEIHDTKNTAQNNKEKINWLLYTAVGGIVISVITTILSNLLTK